MQLGIGGRYDIVNPGTPSRLDGEQLSQLKADLVAGPQSCGFESGTWTARLVAGHVRRKFGAEYKTVSMYDILPKLGFSCKKPEAQAPQISLKTRQGGVQKKSS